MYVFANSTSIKALSGKCVMQYVCMHVEGRYYCCSPFEIFRFVYCYEYR